MKKYLIILLFLPLFSFGQGYTGSYFKARVYFDSPVYKLNGVDLDSANTIKKGFFTKFQYVKLQGAKQKNDSILNSGFATNYKLSLLAPTSSNTIYGNLAGHSISSGTNNVLIGYRSGYLVNSGIKNVIIGHNAGYQSTAINYCTFIGYNAGYNTINNYNTFIGGEAGYTNRTGTQNTFIGTFAGRSNYSGNGSIMIGYNAGLNETGSNKLYIENSSEDSTSALIFGNFLSNKLVFNGKVGIGITNPSTSLHISSTDPKIRIEDQITNDYWDITTDDNDGELVFTSSSGGNFGIDKVPNYKLDVNGTIKASAQVYQAGTFAGIYVADASAAQNIANGTTYTKSTAFTTNGLSSNCTSDATNDKITITKTGKYFINGSFSFSGANANITWRGCAFLNGVEQNNIHWKRKITTAGDSGSASFCGSINVTSVPVDLDFRLRHDSGTTQGITIEYANLFINYIGE